uniref:Lipoprotein n=1 Tax=Leersia perrieri TaxID=77586 RepID=A0A0D9WEU5_9ORYZ
MAALMDETLLGLCGVLLSGCISSSLWVGDVEAKEVSAVAHTADCILSEPLAIGLVGRLCELFQHR